jgi:hypothetical protein
MQTSVEISGACFYPAKMSKFFKSWNIKFSN